MKYFTRREKSLEGFICAIEKTGATHVRIEPFRNNEGDETSMTGGLFACSYGIKFISQAPNGRPIIFEEKYGGHDALPADPGESNKYTARCFITAEDRLQAITSRLPKVKACIISEAGEMDKKSLNNWRKHAMRHKLRPFTSGQNLT